MFCFFSTNTYLTHTNTLAYGDYVQNRVFHRVDCLLSSAIVLFVHYHRKFRPLKNHQMIAIGIGKYRQSTSIFVTSKCGIAGLSTDHSKAVIRDINCAYNSRHYHLTMRFSMKIDSRHGNKSTKNLNWEGCTTCLESLLKHL